MNTLRSWRRDEMFFFHIRIFGIAKQYKIGETPFGLAKGIVNFKKIIYYLIIYQLVKKKWSFSLEHAHKLKSMLVCIIHYLALKLDYWLII